jgi:adenylate cyclase
VILALIAWFIQYCSVGVLERYEAKPYDLRMRKFVNKDRDPRIVLVAIDDETRRLELFNREAHAQFLLNMKDYGAKAVFMDVLFDQKRDPEIDEILGEAVRENGKVVMACALELVKLKTDEVETLVLRRAKLIDPLERCFADRACWPGIINTYPDPDTVTRSAAIAMRSPEMETPWPSPALALYAIIHDLKPKDLEFDAKSDRVIAPPLAFPTKHVDTVEENDERGRELYKLPIDFLPPATGPNATSDPRALPIIPYHYLIDPESRVLRCIQDDVIIVGDNSSGDADVYSTSVGPMKGFEIHAQILNTLMKGPYLREVPEWLRELITLGFCLALTHSVLRARTKWGVIGLVVLVLSAQTGLYLAGFLVGWHILLLAPLAGSLLAIVMATAARIVLTASVLERYVPPEVVSAMLSAGRTRPRTVVATIIVTDIRGYTTLSEGRSPVQMLRLLNEYHSVTVAIYEKYGGRALTYQGDAQIIAFTPRRWRNPAANAILAAQEMQQAVSTLRVHWGLLSREEFDVGAAVCTGPVTIGEIGTTGAGRAEYTVIGQIVRTAHKIQSLSQEVGHTVLLDEATLSNSNLSIHVEDVTRTLEGTDTPTVIYGLRSV